jgi:hypothetical protein
MAQVKIVSTMRLGEVYVRYSDIIKDLYCDLANIENPDVKKYIQASIELWEKYDDDILQQAKNK